MAQKIISAKQNAHPLVRAIRGRAAVSSIGETTHEEQMLVQMYRELARWDRNFYFLILQSLAWGRYTSKTDKMSWGEIRRQSELHGGRKAVQHG
jgi:hypothetical protein